MVLLKFMLQRVLQYLHCQNISYRKRHCLGYIFAVLISIRIPFQKFSDHWGYVLKILFLKILL